MLFHVLLSLYSIATTIAEFIIYLQTINILSGIGAAGQDYEEIRDSHLDADESVNDSSWSDGFDETSSNPSDVINYYIQPVNEYENTVLVLYENYMESQDPVCEKDNCKEKTEKREKSTENRDDEVVGDDDDDDDGGYEIPEKTQITLTYDILSNSPVELFLFVDNLYP